MFESSLITDGKDAFFHYVNAKGEISAQSIVNVIEKDDFFQGYSLTRKAFRTFKKDRVLKMFTTEESMNAEEIPEKAPHAFSERPHTKSKTTNTGLEICFTGFKQADKARLTAIAKEHHLAVKGDISANLYFLCIGENKGWRKIQKATERNSLIVSEAQFLEFINTGEIPYEAPEIDAVYEEGITSEIEELQQMLETLSLTFRTIREPRRSTALIANFKDGYVLGWRFAVNEAFKEALDIKRTKITFEKNIYEAWTQGTSYQFQRGDTFYSDKLGYTAWDEFIKLPDAVVLQIKYDCYSGYETIAYFEGVLTGDFNPNRLITPKKLEQAPILMESQSYDPGTVTVEMLIPNENKTGLTTIDELTMTQDDFISLLQSGRYWRRKSGEVPVEVDLFANDRS